MKFQLGAMSVGDILDRGLKILFARLGTFFAINLILLLPMLVVELATPMLPPELAILASFLLMVAVLVAVPVSAGATIQVIAKEYVGEQVSAGSSIGFAFGRFGALLGTTILAGLIIGLGALLIIPGIIFALNYALMNQVVMVEGLGGGAALNRSKELARGFRGRIFVIGLILNILLIIVTLGLRFAFPPGGPPIFPGEVGSPLHYTNYAINQVGGFLINVVLGAYVHICLTLVYFDLRVRKEAYDLEIAARQFMDPKLTPE